MEEFTVGKVISYIFQDKNYHGIVIGYNKITEQYLIISNNFSFNKNKVFLSLRDKEYFKKEYNVSNLNITYLQDIGWYFLKKEKVIPFIGTRKEAFSIKKAILDRSKTLFSNSNGTKVEKNVNNQVSHLFKNFADNFNIQVNSINESLNNFAKRISSSAIYVPSSEISEIENKELKINLFISSSIVSKAIKIKCNLCHKKKS